MCCAHAVQDGLVALQFVLLPVLAQSLGLNYTQVGVLKAFSNLAMSALEIPAGILAERTGEKWLLVAGLTGAGLGYAGVSVSQSIGQSFALLCLFFLLAGCGAAFQHSLCSSLMVKRFQGARRRKALGTYNAFGDVGKLMYTASFGLILGFGVGWNVVVMILAVSAIIFAGVVWYLLQSAQSITDAQQSSPVLNDHEAASSQVHNAQASSTQLNNLREKSQADQNNWGILNPVRFIVVGSVVFLDSIVQAVFLVFIAFILIEKGSTADVAAFGVVLTLSGGTAGKFAAGFLAARFGDRVSFISIQLATIAGMIAVITLPLVPLLFVLPLIGVVVQGSSTVCYGSVADHIDENKSARGYALVYTLASLAAVVGPLSLGWVADSYGLEQLVWSLMIITAITIAFGFSFYPKLKSVTA